MSEFPCEIKVDINKLDKAMGRLRKSVPAEYWKQSESFEEFRRLLVENQKKSNCVNNFTKSGECEDASG